MFAVPENTIAQAASPTAAHPQRVARAVALDRAKWAGLLRYDPVERYTALIERTPEYEVWLMSWLPGQSTDLHDHGDATGAFTVVSGVLTERVLRSGLVHDLRAGQSRVFAPGYAHQVVNYSIDPAVSIHVYETAREMRSFT
ncbi:cysteine dioxygenase family protein [Actinocrispum sp. NPDC049592]|uniref:cysteine dioxygenase n=1 Tax=Actinocrispum sp. NPDC049592 TaxID=3154835 RepID=UPI003442951C